MPSPTRSRRRYIPAASHGATASATWFFSFWDQVVENTNPAVDFPFAFTGREFDKETSLYYYRARYYSPKLGRFISEDPLGFAAGDTNLSRYVGNSPTGSVDPQGLQPEEPDRAEGDQDPDQQVEWVNVDAVPGLRVGFPPCWNRVSPAAVRMVEQHLKWMVQNLPEEQWIEEVESILQFSACLPADMCAHLTEWLERARFVRGQKEAFLNPVSDPSRVRDLYSIAEVHGDHWARIIGYADRAGYPTTIPCALLACVDFAPDKTYHFRSGFRHHTIFMSKGDYALLMEQGIVTSSMMAALYNEMFHAYYYEYIRFRWLDIGDWNRDAQWIRDIMRAEGYPWKIDLDGAYYASEEAMSECAQRVINELNAQAPTAGRRPISPPKFLYKSVVPRDGVGEGHEYWPLPLPRSKKEQGEPMSPTLFYLTLWILYNGTRDPGGDNKEVQLSKWYHCTFRP